MAGIMVDNSKATDLKQEYLGLLIDNMRDLGYIVRRDIDPDFTMEYIEGEGFEFDISIYGTKVGKKLAKKVQYLDGYKPTHFKVTTS